MRTVDSHACKPLCRYWNAFVMPVMGPKLSAISVVNSVGIGINI